MESAPAADPSEPRRPAGVELRRSEAVCRVLAEATGSVVCTMSPSGRFEVEEPAWEAFSGQPFEAYRGSGWLEALHPDDRPRVAAEWGRAVDRQAPYETEYRFRTSDGQGRTAVARAAPVRDPSGKVAEWIWVLTDVTEQREREAQLHLLRQAVEASTNGILITDAVQTDTPMVYVNPAFTAITGYQLEEALGRNCQFLQGDDRDQEGLRELRRALGEQRSVSVIVRNYRKDGAQFCNELHVSPVKAADGSLLNYVGVMTDVTERVAAERRQQESTEALRALTQRLVHVQEQERRSLALELHDEIGQGLTALKFTLDRIDRTAPTPAGLLTEAREMVRGLQDQVRALSLDLRPSMLDDFGLVPAVVWLCERTERHMGLKVRFTAPEALPPVPPDVATAAFRIVQEALTNVVRHAGVTEADVTLHVDDDGLMMGLTVADDGVGFSLSPSAPATSGLSGMHERASLAGGNLTVEARPGGGTVVRARLPLTPPVTP